MDAQQVHRSSDGRRRRRLATGDDAELLAEYGHLTAKPCEDSGGLAELSTPEQRILTRLIPWRIWKHALLIAIISLSAAFALWAETRQLGLDVESPRGITTLRLTPGMVGVFLLLAGQLSLFVGWIRSESTVDFDGRYRWWKWLAALLLTTGLLWIANAQHSLPAIAQSLARPIIGDVTAARRTLIVVPVAALSILVFCRVIPDMGRNWISQFLFSAGILMAVIRMLMVYSYAAGPLPTTVLDAVLLTSAGFLVCSLLLHSRFVLYICNDPPAGGRTPVLLQRRVDNLEANSDSLEEIASLCDASPVTPAEPCASNVSRRQSRPKKRRTISQHSGGRKKSRRAA